MRKIAPTVFVVLGYLVYYTNFTAVGAIIDSRLACVILALACTAWAAILLQKDKSVINYSLTALSLILIVFTSYEYFFRYDEEEIIFSSAGYNLNGTLYTPKQGADCLVIILHGSGSQTRKEYGFHARQLARHGVAALAYDKRGSGKSQGDTYGTDYFGYAEDASNAIKKIKETNSFRSIGLMGISEGEWVSLIVDSLTEVNFIVLVSASGTSPLEQTHRELTFRLANKNFNSSDIAEAAALYRSILTFDNDSVTRLSIESKIEQAKNKPWFQAAEDFDEELYYYLWWNKVMNFNPRPYLEKSRTPLLVLVGSANPSYPFQETIENFSPFPNAMVKVFEGADHALLEWKLGQGVPPPSYAEGYLKTYTDWIKSQCDSQ